MTRERQTSDAVAMRIYFGGYERIRKTQEGRGRGRGWGRRLTGRRSGRVGAIAIDHFTFDREPRLGHVFTVLIVRVRVHIEDPEANSGFREISAYGHLDSC